MVLVDENVDVCSWSDTADTADPEDSNSMNRKYRKKNLVPVLSKDRLKETVETYFGSKHYVFTLLRTQPTANVVVGEALGVSVGGNWVPVHTG